MKNSDLLDSWKEISDYLERDVRTCIRWEKELGLPVHRVNESSKRSKVFAYRSEIDTWLKQKAENDAAKRIFLLGNRRHILTAITIFFIISLVLTILYLNELINPQYSRISLAVLPFENQSSSEYDEYLSAGIMNDIIAKIMNIGRFEVIPTTLQGDGRNNPISEEEFLGNINPDYILRGGTQKDEFNITIMVNLTRREDGKTIFAQEFHGPVEDLFTLQMEVCRKIYESVNLPFDENRFRETSNYMTFNFLAKGNFILESFIEDSDDPWKLSIQGQQCQGYFSKEANDLAIALFEKALEIDKECARAYIGLAHCYANLVNMNWDKNPKLLEKAEELTKTGQQFEPDLPEYFSTLIEIYLLQEANLYINKKEQIQKLARRGLEKHPYHAPLNSIVGYYYFSRFGEQGNLADFTKALELKSRAYTLNPYTTMNYSYTELLMLNQDYDKAISICQYSGRDDLSLNTLYRLGEICYYSGDLLTSKMYFNQIKPEFFTDEINRALFLGMMAAQAGDRETAQKMIDKLNIMIQEGVLPGFNLKMASIYMGLGEREKGLQYLDTFFQKPYAKLRHHIYLKYINIDKNFAPYKEEIFNTYKNLTGEII